MANTINCDGMVIQILLSPNCPKNDFYNNLFTLDEKQKIKEYVNKLEYVNHINCPCACAWTLGGVKNE